MPPVGEMAVCTPLAPAGFTTVPLGVSYALPVGAVGEVCKDAGCAMATLVVNSITAIPDINNFFIITPFDD
jgi:hypothetical protein